MANEVEINVKSNDKTDFGKIKRNAKGQFAKAGDESGKEYGRTFGASLMGWFTGKGRKTNEDGGKQSGKGFGAGFKKWFVGDGSKLFGKTGQISGDAFGSGFTGMLKTPILGPALLAALTAAVTVAAPAAGAIAGAGIVTGFGAGLAGLGLVIASKSKVVQDKWSSTMKQVGADARLMAAPFESTLISIADIFKRTVDRFNPALSKAFQKMAVPIENFADDAGRALEKLIPAIDPVTEAFDAVLGATGPALQDALGSTSDGLVELADSVQKNPEALADTVRGAGDLTKSLLGLITKLNDANNKFSDLTHGTSAVTALFKAIQYGSEYALKPLTSVIDALGLVADTSNALSHSTEVQGKSMSDAANKTVLLARGLQTAGDGAKHAADANAKAAPTVEALATKIARQDKATNDLVTSLFRLQNGYLTLAGAQVSFEASLDNATASIKANGKTLDIGTEKGRNNKQALIDLAKAANDQTESMLRNNKGQLAAYQAAGQARAGFVRLAQQMGATKPQAEAMARSMIAIPNVTREARLKANKADLDKKLAQAKAQLADKNLTKERRAQLNADIKKLQRQIAIAQATINGLHGKTVVNSVITNFTSKGVNLQTPSRVGGKWGGGPVMPGLARGGSPLSAREFMSGEYGPEVVKVDGTGNVRVTPAGNTARRMQQTAAAGVQEIRLVLEGRGDVGEFLIKMLQPAIKARGGNLQVILAGARS